MGLLSMCLFCVVGCGENDSPINPTEKFSGTITRTQESTFTQPTHSVIRTPDGVVKRVYGIWGQVGDEVIIENATTF